ncbi:glycoside hydrolase family 79 protein [Grosmannia clavigera kw1407]|uniref:Glycoside hydrolase family 79 protein n=1 Tax=Grosmannia clavigera (strain kw1407 / UAMH 11150) TaxID=655863 RepID=F0XRG7_GROCL|nr:glycoside hydrolase family 79 protein [Grosmannia clavigera kw1407]EFW99801.1 glycoside hydrolase family 79 protein [Grosmannia clavigera kw1407]
MAAHISRLTLLALATAIGRSSAATVSYAVPTSVHSGSTAYATVEPASLGISFEFFAFPSYFTNVTATLQCLANWEALTGVWPPIRIGGTTQDRATYDPTTSAYVVYSVASATDAPAALTYGPAFLALAGTYGGSVVLGLNRESGNVSNTIAAAQAAVSAIGNRLLAVELGNEPDYWGRTVADDFASQNSWDILVGRAVGREHFVQAGNWLSSVSTWGAAALIATENTTARSYVATYAHHDYPGGSLTSLMAHANVAANIGGFAADVAAAQAVGRPYVLGETNSATGGGASSVSPTYGAALWTLDFAVRAAAANISRTYFHHGTIGNCQYCFWGRHDMGAPYYGATAAVAFLAGASSLAALDDGKSAYAAYATFDAAGKPLRALLYNSDYYGGSGTRSATVFTLTGLSGIAAGSTVRARRLTAASALARQDKGSLPTWAGQTYTNGNCVVSGTETYETATVSGGQASFTLQASEALVVDLQ